MADARNCPIYGLLALRYFAKCGHNFFNEITPYILDNQHKITDRDNNAILHLKIDGLPAPLYKYTNRQTLARINAMYNHEWMPSKITLPAFYQETNTENFLSDKLSEPVGKPFGSTTGHTLAQKIAQHEAPKQAKTSGHFFQYNHAADRKMLKARQTILQSLTAHEVIETVEASGNTVNKPNLEIMVRKIKQ